MWLHPVSRGDIGNGDTNVSISSENCCEICGMTNPKKSHADHHRLYFCVRCDQVIPKVTRTNHKCTGEKIFKCDICDHSSASKTLLADHVRAVHHNTFRCDNVTSGVKCTLSFSTKKKLWDHQGKKHDLGYICPECGKIFSSSGGRNNHILLKHKKNPISHHNDSNNNNNSQSQRPEARGLGEAPQQPPDRDLLQQVAQPLPEPAAQPLPEPAAQPLAEPAADQPLPERAAQPLPGRRHTRGSTTPSSTTSASSRGHSPRLVTEAMSEERGGHQVPGVKKKVVRSARNSANLAGSSLQEDLMRLISPEYNQEKEAKETVKGSQGQGPSVQDSPLSKLPKKTLSELSLMKSRSRENIARLEVRQTFLSSISHFTLFSLSRITCLRRSVSTWRGPPLC